MNRNLPAILFFSLFLLLAAVLRAQISDDFSDGNFTDNPAWQGETTEFKVNPAGELQLNAPDAGSSMLVVAGNIPDSAVWLLDVRLEFAPSTANLLRLYLLADQPDLLQSNAYFLEMGETGNTDAIKFYRQDGTSSTLLATGVPGFVAGDPVDIRLRVTRSAAGNWTIEAAPKGGAFEIQGTAADPTYSGGVDLFFGVYCLYTATRKDKFFFDNLSVLPDLPDAQPPVLISATALDAVTVSVVFDEDLDPVSTLDVSLYSISGVGQPIDAQFAAGSARTVLLSLPAPLQTGSYVLETTQISDLNGNAGGVQSASFQFLKIETAGPFDILINEIMADPSPTAGLPEVEWVELFNRSNKVIDLQTLRLSDGGTPQPLPAGLLEPDSFLVLSTSTGAAALTGFTPNVKAMTGIPSLNNDGDPLSLTDQSGILIDLVNYSINWHTVTVKRDGGWSLERINPELPCLEGQNWQSCPVTPGGTPGRANASLQTGADSDMPHLVSVFLETPFVLHAIFSEGLDQTSAAVPAAYRLEPNRAIATAMPSATDRKEVVLTLAQPLETGVLYRFTATGLLTDCSGNAAAATDTVLLGLPEVPVPQDIVVNEILFNPATGGVDFVEFYNRSLKIFNWQNFYTANFAGSSAAVPSGLNRLFLPGEYAVFTPNPTDINTRFTNVNPNAVFTLALPSFPDDAGNASIYYSGNGVYVMVDSFDYQADYHNALLSSAEQNGVALERIDPDGPTNSAGNWTSAARTVAGDAGTPTRRNSQFLSGGQSTGDELISFEPARLSPDGDGYEDFLDIRYRLPAAGYAATITIFDSGGIPVKRLARQELFGTAGALRWDGDTDDGSPARPGIYILYAEVFSPNGDVKRTKKPFALVRRF